jgi:hemoglobin/transferrin/lactoferrin receptor protein
MVRPSLLALAVSLVLSSARPALAQPQATAASADSATPSEPAATTDPRALDAITVTATRTPQPVGDVAATVTVIDADEIERRVVNDIRGLVRYEPNVSVRNQAGRFGLAGFNIRGLDGNRVLVLLDGVRVADGFAIGDFSNAGRNSVDVDALKVVEVLRGPSSSLYGSNALAGVVSLVTKDPRDYLDPKADADSSLRLRLGHDETDGSTQRGFTAAVASGEWSAMALATRRSGGPLDNQGRSSAADSTRTVPNPQDIDSDALLTRVVRDGDEGRASRLTLDLNDSRTTTEVLSAIREQRLGPTRIQTERLTGDDRQERRRIAFDQTLGGLMPFIADGRVNLYYQSTETRQDTVERRRTIPPAGPQQLTERERSFLFDQTLAGAELVMQSDLDVGPVTHRLVYGLEWVETDTDQLREGRQRNLLTGAVTNVVGPDAFPVRDFPPSTTRELALFVQDEIALFDERLTLVPGIRWDRYRLNPSPDAIFIADNPGIVPVDIETTEASPKFGASFRLDEAWSLHANWARGFRAPPYNDANIGFTNLQFGYTAIPNPDLAPETSEGIELGVRWRGDLGFAALTGFYNRYDDFIESLASLGIDPATGLLVFQSRNRSEVDIRGVELRGSLDLGELADITTGFSLNGSFGWSRGDDRELDQPLNSIDPVKAAIGLRYDATSARWNTELVITAVTGKNRVDDSFGPLFRTPGYATVDWYGRWQATPWLRLDAALLNLGDRKYWQWADVRGRPAGDPVIDRFTSPGRSAALNLIVEF